MIYFSHLFDHSCYQPPLPLNHLAVIHCSGSQYTVSRSESKKAGMCHEKL